MTSIISLFEGGETSFRTRYQDETLPGKKFQRASPNTRTQGNSDADCQSQSSVKTRQAACALRTKSTVQKADTGEGIISSVFSFL